jgi:ATP-dependent Clp protease ATP-binding subunit ClpC
VLHILLQILEEGKLTDGAGRNVNFKNTIVVMTTNIGSERLQSPLPMGFITPSDSEKQDIGVDRALEEIKNQFRPELINRIDEIVVFNTLTKENIGDIVDLNFEEYILRIKSNHDINVFLDKSGRELFIEKGYDEKYGAREVRRTVQRMFETKMAVQILNGKYKSSDTIVCYAKGDELKFRKKSNRGKSQRS